MYFLFILLLQAEAVTLDDTLWGMGIIASVMIIVFFLARYYARRREERMEKPPYTKTVNDSNYDIAGGALSEEQLADVDPADKAEVREKLKKADYVPTDEEFHTLKKS